MVEDDKNIREYFLYLVINFVSDMQQHQLLHLTQKLRELQKH